MPHTLPPNNVCGNRTSFRRSILNPHRGPSLSTPLTAAHPRAIRLRPEDYVVIAIDIIPPGGTAAGLTARERILKGHKMAVEPIRESEPIKKFGQIIGFATKHIAPGEWVHEHNVGLHDFERDYRFAEDARDDGLLPENLRATFQGYRR